MLLIDIPVGIFTLGIGLIATNFICVIWAMIAVNNHNKKIGQPQQFQQIQHTPPSFGGFQPPPPAGGTSTGGFQTFDGGIRPPSQPQAPPQTQPTAPPSKAAEYNTAAAPEFRSFSAPPSSLPATGTPGTQPLNTFGDWITQNTRGLLIAAGAILGLALLVVAVKFLLSLDFKKATPPETSATTSTAQPVTPKNDMPVKEVVNTPPATHPVEAAKPVSTSSSSTADLEMEKDSGFGFVKTQQGSPLNMHEKPSKETATIKQIPNGGFVHILGHTSSVQMDGEAGRWLKVSFVGAEGWVWEKFIERR
jgi:hypothetical protein